MSADIGDRAPPIVHKETIAVLDTYSHRLNDYDNGSAMWRYDLKVY